MFEAGGEAKEDGGEMAPTKGIKKGCLIGGRGEGKENEVMNLC